MTDYSPCDPETGSVRLYVDTVDAASYAGDNARGEAINALYISSDGDRGACAEILTHVVEYDDGSFGVDEMVTIGRAMLEDGNWRPDDSADIDYDYASALAYATLEDAQRDCDRLGARDASFALYLRAHEESEATR